jgi:hypothetical protein
MVGMSRSRTLVMALGLAAFALVLSGCSVEIGKKTIQISELERQSAKALAGGSNEEGIRMDCPGKSVEAKKGEKIKCKLTASDGTELDATITLTDDKGAFKVEAGEQPKDDEGDMMPGGADDEEAQGQAGDVYYDENGNPIN